MENPLTTTVKRLASTEVELEIPIEGGELEAARERAFRTLAKKAKLPGFRPGKIPRKLFEQQFGSATIAERAIEDLVPEVYSRAIRENELEPVAKPEMELLPAEDGTPLRLRARVAVRPEIELKNYKSVTLSAPGVVVSDHDVETALITLARDAGTLVPVDRAVQLGDIATIAYTGTIDGKPFPGGSAKEQPLEMEEGRFLPGFVTGIVGMRAGEEKTIALEFPAGYGVPELAGKAASFAVTVHEVKELQVPAVDDEFAIRVSSETTLAALKDEIRKRLVAVGEARRRRALGDQLLGRLLEMHDFPLPEILVERETQAQLDELKSSLARAGQEWSTYLQSSGQDETALRVRIESQAKRRVKTTLLIEAIAKAEKIEAKKSEVDRELDRLAQRYGQPRSTVVQALRGNMLAIVDGIVRDKTLDFLLEQANVREETNETLRES